MNAQQASEREAMQECLRLCLEYLEKHYDVEDSPSGYGQVPNEAMRLGNEIKYVLGLEP